MQPVPESYANRLEGGKTFIGYDLWMCQERNLSRAVAGLAWDRDRRSSSLRAVAVYRLSQSASLLQRALCNYCRSPAL